MATAPKPGAVRKAEAKRTALAITLGKDEYVLNVGDLGPHDDIVSRRQTGMPVSAFFEEEQFGLDSLLILYWTARRKNGEPALKFATVLQQFPTYESVAEAGFKVEEVTEDDESDPLPSGEG